MVIMNLAGGCLPSREVVECRTYGAPLCGDWYPALTRWAKFCRALGWRVRIKTGKEIVSPEALGAARTQPRMAVPLGRTVVVGESTQKSAKGTDGKTTKSAGGGVKPPLQDRSEDRPLHKKEKRRRTLLQRARKGRPPGL